MKIREVVKRIIYGYRYSSQTYVEHLRKKGVEIGEDCKIYVPTKTLIDEQYPWMITIGNHVRITEGVKILTHDFSWAVLKGISGGMFGASGTVKIGNNVFIGMNSIVTCNVEIGENVIIGAGSVVTKNCESNSVYAGVPAKRIMGINDFLENRKAKQLQEAELLAKKFFERYGKIPMVDVFHEYFMLFERKETIPNNDHFMRKIELCGNKEQTLEYLKNYKPEFENYEDFIEYCIGKKNN